MGLFQSYQQVFVTNSPALLAEGKTVDSLAVGQIGFLDAKTYKGVTAPTYAKNKALYAVWGTADIDGGNFSGMPNENEYSKIIKGKFIKRIRAHKAQRGVTPLYTVGWSGDAADTDTLFANAGEKKVLFVKLTGTVIDRLYSKQGVVKQFIYEPPCTNDCTDDCAPIKCTDIAKQISDQMNADRDFKQFIRTKSLIKCTGTTAPVTATCYKFKITVCDTGDAASLGVIQAQYPNEKVVLISRDGALSTYGVVKDANTAPAAFTSTGVFIPECPTCPAGYTLIPTAKTYQVRTPEGKTVADVQAAFTDETSVTLISTDPQFNVFMVTFPTTTTDASVQASATTAGFVATFVGVQTNICQQTTPTSTAWASDGTLEKQAKKYRITLADGNCGTNRLTEVQAAYPDLVVTVVDSAGTCVHTYETSVFSNCYELGCAISQIKFVAPAMFEGAEWKELVVADTSTDCKCGIQVETAFVNRNTNECTFDSFPYENDIVHVQFSNYNPDFNGDPCENDWVVKQIRSVQYPMGHGRYIQQLEKESKQYDQRFRNWDNVVREVQGYSFQADASKFYDQYVIEFGTKYFTSGGWSEQYEDSWSLNLFVPEGTGQAIENLVNGYASSAGIEQDGVAI